MNKKKGLGRGINAIIGASPVDEILEKSEIDQKRVIDIALSDIEPNPMQPRERFNEQALRSLADSIREHGVIQPIIVSRKGAKYYIIAGERRYRAAGRAQLESIPAIVRDSDEVQDLSLALIENIQRENLNAIEEAKAYQLLITRFSWKQQQLADKMGIDRATVANKMRLLSLPQEIQMALISGELSASHARALLGIEDADTQKRVMAEIIRDGLSVRDVENAIKGNEYKKTKQSGVEKKSTERKSQPKDPHLRVLEDELRQKLGTKVEISYNNQKGKIEIFFYSLEDFDRIHEIIVTK